MIGLDSPEAPWSPSLFATAGGFGWWYADLIDHEERHAVLIVAGGLPMAAPGRGVLPSEHLTLNVAVYERGRLVFGSDYVRERMMKTDVTVRPDGSFTLDTTNSGEAATRWVTRLQGKKVLGPVPGSGRTDGSDDTEPGEGGATDET